MLASLLFLQNTRCLTLETVQTREVLHWLAPVGRVSRRAPRCMPSALPNTAYLCDGHSEKKSNRFGEGFNRRTVESVLKMDSDTHAPPTRTQIFSTDITAVQNSHTDRAMPGWHTSHAVKKLPVFVYCEKLCILHRPKCWRYRPWSILNTNV